MVGTDKCLDIEESATSWLSSIVRDNEGNLRTDIQFPRIRKLILVRVVCEESTPQKDEVFKGDDAWRIYATKADAFRGQQT